MLWGIGVKDSLVEYVNDVKNESLYEYCYILNAPVQIDDEEECDKATVEGFRVEYSGINMKLTVYGLKDTTSAKLSSERFNSLSAKRAL